MKADQIIVETSERVKRQLVAENLDLMQAVDAFGDPVASRALVDHLHQQWRQRLKAELAKSSERLLAVATVAPSKHGHH